MKGTHLGEFEELILLIVGVLNEDAYAVAIKHEIEKQVNRAVSISAIHTSLYRLEEKEYLESWIGGTTATRGGRRKRFFKHTALGVKALKQSHELRNRLWNLILKPSPI